MHKSKHVICSSPGFMSQEGSWPTSLYISPSESGSKKFPPLYLSQRINILRPPTLQFSMFACGAYDIPMQSFNIPIQTITPFVFVFVPVDLLHHLVTLCIARLVISLCLTASSLHHYSKGPHHGSLWNMWNDCNLYGFPP